MRAIESCLRQAHARFELIVVDDGSRDGSAELVERCGDPRLRLIRHGQNRGVGPARNTGIEAATGEWVLCLDSDDELAEDALTHVAARARAAPGDVAALRFMVRLESGELSPDPPLADEVWDYERYVRWVEACVGRRQETLVVIRRAAYATVRYPDDRSYEANFNFDFARRFHARACPEVIRHYHGDAGNQLTKPSATLLLAVAPDLMRASEHLLATHGEALRQWAPRVLANEQDGIATLAFLSGDRRRGVKQAVARLSRGPLNVRVLIVLVLGVVSPRILARVRTARWRIR